MKNVKYKLYIKKLITLFIKEKVKTKYPPNKEMALQSTTYLLSEILNHYLKLSVQWILILGAISTL